MGGNRRPRRPIWAQRLSTWSSELNPFVDDFCSWVTKIRTAFHAPIDPDASGTGLTPRRWPRRLLVTSVLGGVGWLVLGIDLADLIELMPWTG